jgi:hypothetical protein
MLGGESVNVSIEDEAGKVDLNTAAPDVLVRLFSALTRDQIAGGRIVERILARRSPIASSPTGQTQAPQRTPGFTTTLQLDQIDGVTPNLLRMTLPFVTVRSGRTTPDIASVSPSLRKILNLAPTASVPPVATTASEVTIRAEVTADNGARFIREALVSIASDDRRPYVIHEWRRGSLEQRSTQPQPTNSSSARLTDCFEVNPNASSRP